MKKLGLLNESERAFLLGKKNNSPNEKGQLRKRIDEKANRLDVGDLMFDVSHLLNEDKLNLLVKGLVSTMRNKFQYLDKTNENIKKENELNKSIKTILKSGDFILRRKIQQDISYIIEDKKRISIFRFVHKHKESDLNLLKMNFKNSKYTITQLYERGLLIPKGLSKKEFIKLCIDKIKNNDYKTISKSLKLYELYPLELKGENKRVVINPLYDYSKINYSEFKRASSPYFNLQFSLRRLLIDDLYNLHELIN